MDIHHHEYCNFFSVCSHSTLQPSKRLTWKSCVFPTGEPHFVVFSIPILASFYLKFSYHFSSRFMLSLHLELCLGVMPCSHFSSFSISFHLLCPVFSFYHFPETFPPFSFVCCFSATLQHVSELPADSNIYTMLFSFCLNFHLFCKAH